MSNPRLLEIVRQVSHQCSLSRKTENAYINHIRRFQNFYATRNLAEIRANGISVFLNHLKENENFAVSTLNQAFSALSFLYREVFGLNSRCCLRSVKRAKPSPKIPVIFTPEEAQSVLSNLHGDCFLAAALMYGSGLRLSEVVALRIRDIDFEERAIFIRNSRTGRRDHTTILTNNIIQPLKDHLVNVRYLHEDDCLLGYGKTFLPDVIERKNLDAALEWCWQFVFPARHLTFGEKVCRHHLAESTVQKAVSEAIQKANVFKHAGCQTFRGSFAVRLLKDNYDIRRIQNLLGHKNLKTTRIYAQLDR